MNRFWVCLFAFASLFLTVGCHNATRSALTTDDNGKQASPVNAKAGLPPDFCAPLGDPIPNNSLLGANAFAVCRVGDSFNTQLWGRATQYSIRCKPDTLRSGWKWVIYCNADGSHCACNRESIEASPADPTCCAFKAGDHCTVNGEARPGRNGCEAW